jgi:shikimate kinase
MPKPRRVFLVGLMGAGKTTIGRHLAGALGLHFVDSDEEIIARTGVEIPLIFEIEGEAGFRAREHRVIDELTQQADIVLATGGGVVLEPLNRHYLKERGYVVYLRAPVHILVHRTRRDRKRPLLQDCDPRTRLEDLYRQRDPLYREVADLVVDTENHSLRQIVAHICQQLTEHGYPAS